MGVGICTVFQAQNNGQWEEIDFDFDDDTDGTRLLFAWLCGVRNRDHIEPIGELRGWPDNFIDGGPVGYDTHRGKWMGDSHSGWFLGSEILEAANHLRPKTTPYTCVADSPPTPPGEYREKLAFFIDEVQKRVDEHGEIRIVFGFHI